MAKSTGPEDRLFDDPMMANLIADESALPVAQQTGVSASPSPTLTTLERPVVTSASGPHRLGAMRASIIIGELSAVYHALDWIWTRYNVTTLSQSSELRPAPTRIPPWPRHEGNVEADRCWQLGGVLLSHHGYCQSLRLPLEITRHCSASPPSFSKDHAFTTPKLVGIVYRMSPPSSHVSSPAVNMCVFSPPGHAIPLFHGAPVHVKWGSRFSLLGHGTCP